MENESLQFKEIPAEQKNEAILGILEGPCADFISGTRNGRKYDESLWDKVFKDPIVNELIDNGGIPGELDHPTDREETDSSRIAILLKDKPEKRKDGKLWAKFSILNTPLGQIAYTLAKAGFNLGISSRGTGDTFVDYDGEEKVDESTYDFKAFDLVITPAVKAARLKLVAEGLKKKFNYKKALVESLSKANTQDRKLMKEALDNLDIDVDLKDENDFELLVQYVEDNEASYVANYDTQEQAENAAKTMEEKGEIVHYQVYDKNGDIVAEDDNNKKDMIEENINKATDNLIKIIAHVEPVINEALPSGNKEDTYDNETIDEWLKFADSIEDYISSIGDVVSAVESKHSLSQYIDFYLKNNAGEKIDYMIDLRLSDHKQTSTAKNVRKKHAAKIDTKYKLVSVTVNDKTFDTYDEAYNYVKSMLDNIKAECNDESRTDIKEDVNNDAIVDGKADVTKQLQEALKQIKKLEKEVVSLNEQLSICYAKDVESRTTAAKLLRTAKSLSESKHQNEVLSAKVTKLTEELEKSNKTKVELETNVRTLQEKSIKTTEQLNEQLKTKDDSNKLNESLSKLKGEHEKLTVAYATLQKDSNQLKEDFAKKLTNTNKLVEKYKSIAVKSVDKYINSQAIRLGVSSNEIKNRLPESYSFTDIDKVCNTVQQTQLNLSTLPISTSMSLTEGMKIGISSKKQNDANNWDDVDDDLLKLAKLK